MMFKKSLLPVIVILPSLTSVFCATYTLSDEIVGTGFYNSFDWQNISDPTHGRVNYVDKTVSQSLNLTFASSNTFILRGDSKTVLSANGAGRNSVRIQSKKTYRTHVAVFDVRHMPEGCGTWPAVWEVAGSGWPNTGEVDIVEGVNNQGPNAVSLHTSAGCTMPASRQQTGTSTQLDCNTNINGGTGCGVLLSSQKSFGPTFNQNGGGWYAVERSATAIKVWFWARTECSVPNDVQTGNLAVDPSNWGVPSAYFPNTTCDLAARFSDHYIIINLTFCGDWAGGAYAQSGCPSTCVDYVNKNPSSFVNAYFDFASLRVYQ